MSLCKDRMLKWHSLIVLVPVVLSVCLGILACTDSPGGSAGQKAPTKKDLPEGKYNVLLVSVDTLRRDHLPIYGYQNDTAPNVSELARSAVVFDRAIAANTNTAPSHTSMLTGTYPLTHGVIRNGYRLRPNIETLAQILKSHGYVTGAFVSSHTLVGRTTRLNRGFDVYRDQNGRVRDRRAAATFGETALWLDDLDRTRPFFLFLHLFDPHQPYDPPRKFASRFLPAGRQPRKSKPDEKELKRLRLGPGPTQDEIVDYTARYDAEIFFADYTIGRLFGKLKEMNLFDRSLIVFLSDHGETLAERRYAFDHGGRAYDEQIRIPLVIRFPNGQWGGGRSPGDAHHVDVMPTVLDFLGIDIPASIKGMSLMDSIKNPAKKEQQRLMFSHARPEPIRMFDFGKQMAKNGQITSLRRPPFKLISYPAKQGTLVELFDLTKDPKEKKNRAADLPQVVQEFQGANDRWLHSMGADKLPHAPKLSEEDVEALRSLGYTQ